MVWYVALVAIVNVALGYAAGVYLGRGCPARRLRALPSEPAPYEEDTEYDSSDSGSYYPEDADAEEAELQGAEVL